MKQSDLLKEICGVSKRKCYLEDRSKHWTTQELPKIYKTKMLEETARLSKYLKTLKTYLRS